MPMTNVDMMRLPVRKALFIWVHVDLPSSLTLYKEE